MKDHLQVVTVHRGSVSIVAICGELDMATTSQLDRVLRNLDGDVHLDCHHLTFLDSSGIATLLFAHERCLARGHELFLHGLSAAIRRTLAITGLDCLLNVTGNCRDSPYDARSPHRH